MPVAPLPLRSSWPIYESRSRLGLGRLWDLHDLASDVPPTSPAEHGVGEWSFDLRATC